MTEFANARAADPILMALIEASSQGSEEVERRMSTLISEPLDDIVTGNGV